MSKGDKYLELKYYLQKVNAEEIILSFQDIEQILNFKLPPSAYKHAEAWWSNNYDHSQAISWIEAGYQTDFVTDTYANEKIIFVKM